MSLIKAARGTIPVDLLITDTEVANVFTGEIYPADIAIYDGRIAAVEEPGTSPAREARETLRGEGLLAVPGLVDSHLHIESSLLTPAPFAEAVLRHGTTTIAEDPHEIANAVGLSGVRRYWEASAGLPVNVYFLASSCVPAAAGLETCQGEMGPEAIGEMLTWDRVIGLAEVMDAHAVVDETPRMSGILDEGRRAGGVIEGHNPMLRGRDLNAYVAAGVTSDHTLMTPDLLWQKLRLGICVQLQERYLSEELISRLLSMPRIPEFCLVTDDVSPDYLDEVGHLDQVIRRSIELGMPEMLALQASTIYPARRLRLYDTGAIAPGYRADIALIDDLSNFSVNTTITGGQIVVRGGETRWSPPEEVSLDALRDSLALKHAQPELFGLNLPVDTGQIDLRVIHSHTPGTTTEEVHLTVKVSDGEPILDDYDDLSLIAVIARGGEHRFIGLMQGLGLRDGAVATSHAHDSHNLLVIGRDRRSMTTAANAVIDAGGGIALSAGSETRALVPLPIAGVVSPEPLSVVAHQFRELRNELGKLGVEHPHLLMRLSTYTLPVSTGLRITDRGLVDAAAHSHVPLIIETAAP